MCIYCVSSFAHAVFVGYFGQQQQFISAKDKKLNTVLGRISNHGKNK